MPAVQWHSPSTLIRAGSHALMFRILGGFSDQRDTQRFLPSAIVQIDRPEVDGVPASDVWVDYFADSGDGFNAGATVAFTMAQERLSLDCPAGSEQTALTAPADLTTPAGPTGAIGPTGSIGPVVTRRGALLIQGGDAVYPVADTRAYEDRFVGPMRAMLDHTCDHHPVLVGIPGNHDWMDGLNAWSKIMTQKGWVGGWRTAQERSYFATKLSDRWWVLGVDAHLGDYLDKGQLEFFAETARSFSPGTQVILCIPTPTWIHQAKNAEAHQVIDYLIRKTLTGRGEVRLILTGDLHHYSRYESCQGKQIDLANQTDQTELASHLITAGGGGAFLSSSHWLPDRILLPTPESRDQGKTEPVTYQQAKQYPSHEQSREVGRRFASVGWRNGGFPALIGLLYLALGWNALGASPASASVDAVGLGLVRAGTGFWLAISLVFCVLTTKTKPTESWSVWLPHFVLHVLSLSVLTTLSRLVFEELGSSDRLARALGAWGVAVAGGALGTLVSSFAFFLADRKGLDHLFLSSGVRSTRYRNFVRLRIDEEETLTVFPIGIDNSVTDWSADPGGSGSWFTPDTPIEAFLVEPPIVIRAAPGKGS